MVDADARRRLREAIRHYAAGRITNHDMFHVYASLIRSEDAAVREIGEFWGSTYNSDLSTFRLGRAEIEPALWKSAARCVLFLHTDGDYQWPGSMDDHGLGCLTGLGGLLAVPLTICTACMLFQHDWEWTVNCGVPTAIAWICAAAAAWGYIRTERTNRARIESAGNVDVWPFIGSDALAEARTRVRLLPS
jgi:hypothetical protein